MAIEIRYTPGDTSSENRDSIAFEIELLKGQLNPRKHDLRIRVLPTDGELSFRYRVEFFGRNGSKPFEGEPIETRLYTSEELRARAKS